MGLCSYEDLAASIIFTQKGGSSCTDICPNLSLAVFAILTKCLALTRWGDCQWRMNTHSIVALMA